MINLLFTIFVFVVATCFTIILIMFTICAVKNLLKDTFGDIFDEYCEKRGIRNFLYYIKENTEKEFSSMDTQYQKYMIDSLYDIYRNERWKDNE